MFAICIEASHKMGLGHLFRMLNLTEHLKANNEEVVLFVNEDEVVNNILNEKGVRFETVDLSDLTSGWEAHFIEKYGVEIWINDRLNTELAHSKNVKATGIKLVTFDDHGAGAELADINIAALPCSFADELKGKKVLSGIDYLLLNKNIERFKRLRKEAGNIIVTLGGCDTYGATIKVVRILKELGKHFTVHIGPAFEHLEELNEIIDEDIEVIGQVPSLIETLSKYDLAITGGGMTPFEANAAGLPCIIVANETFEIPNAKFLAGLGSSLFAGFHEDIDTGAFTATLDIERMSAIGMKEISLNGIENIYNEMRAL